MNTAYSVIYEKFAALIEDVKLLSLSDEDVSDMMKEWLHGAIDEYLRCTYDLSDRSDETNTFNIELPEFDQNILAHYMVLEWLSPQINSTLITSQFFSDGQTKFFAQANQLDKLMALDEKNRIQIQKMLRDRGYLTLVKTTTT